MNALAKIAITMGDPAGIGPEICARFLTERAYEGACIPLVFGDAQILKQVANHLGLDLPVEIVPQDTAACRNLDQPAIIDFGELASGMVVPGQISALTGRASHRYLMGAIEAALAGDVAAITTGPIHKEALHAAGISFPGHTEILMDRTSTSRACMMLTSPAITCSFVTGHVGLVDVPKQLTTERILEVIELSAVAMRRLRNHEPSLAVCGLNPHGGEHGLFGRGEEERIILPAIEAARAQALQIEGPLPPDTAFLPTRLKRTDVFICMYHDQGLIPLKMLAFDVAVNVTLGLPIVRTSVDHGTANDIAWKGVAQITSLVEAVQLAAKLVG